MNKDYVIFRAEKEYPDYYVDYKNVITWEKRLSPSVEALAEFKKLTENGVECELGWITDGNDDDDGDGNNNKEAVIITNYLGSYNLIRKF